jgi:hypothetical protein
MSNQTITNAIRDNHFCGSVGDFLRPHPKTSANLSVVSAGDTSASEREIGQQVYAPYGLMPEEIKIVEESARR